MSALGNQQLKIGGNVTDAQIAVGNYILQIGDVNGGIVNVAPPSAPIKFERRTKHVSLKPRPFPSLLDRAEESASIKSAIHSSASVTLFGESGIGKTSLLRNVLNTEKFHAFPDGLTYHSVHAVGLDDIVQLLFDSFFSANTNSKPTDGQIRAELNKINAVIVLDDLALEREQVMSLLNILPQCLFILASELRSLWGEGRVVPLSGLPKNDAVMLFVQELGREALNNETSIIEQICLDLNGHPFRILEMASLAREGKSLSEILKELQGDEPDSAATALVVNSLDQPQKNIVGILGSLGGALVTVDHLRELADIPNIDASLKKLSSLGLIQTDGSKYGIASSIIKTLPQAINLTFWDDAVIKHFANWVVQNPAQGLLEDSLEALAKIIQKAGEKKDWQQVVRIGRALEKILILKKRWQAWADILDLLLRAARALGDRKLEGWVFHQLGSRAMCMGITETARGFLSQAFQIRKAIGDQAGMQLSQHNLNVLLKLFPIPETNGCRRWFTCGTIGAVGSAGIFILILLFTYFSPSSPFTTPPTDVPSIIITNTQFVVKETLTPTPTLIITPSITNTPEPQIFYDFISEASNADWSFGVNDPDGFYEYPIDFIKDPDGSSPEANTNTNISPYAGWDRDPDLEDKSKESLVILAYPAGHSHVQGLYDLKQYPIQTDDQLVVKIGYKNAPTKIFSLLPDSDGVKFKVIFENSEVDIFEILLDEDEFNDRRTQTLVVELSSLAGFSGNFLLQVESHETYYNDFAVWMDAYLQRP